MALAGIALATAVGMKIFHAVVWLDHHEARVCFLHEDEAGFDERRIHAHEHHGHPHRDGHRRDNHTDSFFRAIAQALEPVKEVLLVGPSQTKHELQEFLATHQAELHKRIIGVESADHPTDKQLAAQGRAFFKKADALLHGPRAAGAH
jgi:stalled ribosome rescue protein Dom34